MSNLNQHCSITIFAFSRLPIIAEVLIPAVVVNAILVTAPGLFHYRLVAVYQACSCSACSTCANANDADDAHMEPLPDTDDLSDQIIIIQIITPAWNKHFWPYFRSLQTTPELIISSLRITPEITPELSVEHGRFSILENRTWPIFDFRASNMAYFRFSSVEHGLFSIFGHRTWPIFYFKGIFQFRRTSRPQLPELRSVRWLRYFSDPEIRSVR